MQNISCKQYLWSGPGFFLCAFYALIICTYSPDRAIAAAQEYEIQIDFYFDTEAVPDKLVNGYRLYMENEPVCEIDFPEPQSFTCRLTAESGAYNFSISVLYDDDSESPRSPTFPFSLATPEDEVAFYFELAEVQLTHDWAHFSFSKPFVDPVVIAGPPSFMDTEPVTVRIRNVNPTGFEIRLQEWDYLDDRHGPEVFSYIVMEKGCHTLENGARIEAGSITTNATRKFYRRTMQQAYDQPPVLLTQVMTENENDAVTVRVRKIGKKRFQYRLQEQQSNKNRHSTETIGYIAWEPGNGETSGLFYEAGFVARGVNHRWTDLYFPIELPDLPLFFAGMQTRSEKDAAVIRTQGMSSSAIQLMIEEEQSKDDEVAHSTEVVGYLAIGDATAVVE